MSDSKPDWDALLPLLYKKFWAENEAIYILAGIKPNESETNFTSLRTGKRVPASEAKYLYKHIFDSWTGDSHPWTEGIIHSASYPSWNDYNKYYYLHWVAQKPFHSRATPAGATQQATFHSMLLAADHRSGAL